LANVTVTITDADLNRVLSNLAGRLRDLTPAMEDIGEYMLRVTRKRFDDEVSPGGVKWTPLNPEYAARKAAQGGSLDGILKKSGVLRDTIAYRPSPDSVVIGSNRPYAAIHQLGGQAGRDRKVNIPARPYLGLSAADRREIKQILGDVLGG
jgi:phage virion morphogenesis protein